MSEVTIKDIAKICGVGVSTVSRAMNNHHDINPETKQMVMDAIKKYDYVPNNSARNLKRIEANTIALLVKGMTNPFFSTMIKIMELSIKKRHYNLVLHHVEFNEDEVNVAIELVKEKRLRGIIFLGGSFTQDMEKLKKIQVPYILSTSGSRPENYSRQLYSSVSVDDEKESYKITEYLIKQGHKRIAIIVDKSDYSCIGSYRLKGYLKALKDYQIPVENELILIESRETEFYSMSNGYHMTQELLESGVKFTAIYGTSDTVAIGACKAITDSGKNVPGDYSVAGFDGIELGQYYNPSLTTIRQPVEDMARATIDLLFELIDEGAPNEHQIFEGELLCKESTQSIL